MSFPGLARICAGLFGKLLMALARNFRMDFYPRYGKNAFVRALLSADSNTRNDPRDCLAILLRHPSVGGRLHCVSRTARELRYRAGSVPRFFGRTLLASMLSQRPRCPPH